MTLWSPYNLNVVCKHKLQPEESKRRLDKVVENLNVISNSRYGGDLFQLLSSLNGTKFQKKPDDPELAENKRLINLNETDLMENLDQCQRHDVHCEFLPIIRSPRIAFDSSQDPELAFLPCFSGEESKVENSCNKIAPLSLCCRKDHEQSSCKLESELEPGRRVIRDWLERNFDGKYLFRYSYREDPKWVSSSRFNYCFKMVQIRDDKLKKERTLKSNIIPDEGRTWRSVYEVEEATFNLGPDDIAMAKMMTDQIDSIGLKLFKRKKKLPKKTEKIGASKVNVKPSEVKLSASKQVSGSNLKAKTDTKLSVKLAFDEFRKQQKSLLNVFGKSRRKSRRKGRKKRDMSLNFLELAAQQDREYEEMYSSVFSEGLREFVNENCGITKWMLFKRFLHNLQVLKLSWSPMSEDFLTQMRNIIEFTGNQLTEERCQFGPVTLSAADGRMEPERQDDTPVIMNTSPTSSNPAQRRKSQVHRRSSNTPIVTTMNPVSATTKPNKSVNGHKATNKPEPMQPEVVKVQPPSDPDEEFDLDSLDSFEISQFDLLQSNTENVPKPVDHNSFIGENIGSIEGKNLEFLSSTTFNYDEVCSAVTSKSITKYYLKQMDEMHRKFLQADFTQSETHHLCSLLTKRSSSVCQDPELVPKLFTFKPAGFKVEQQMDQVKLLVYYEVTALTPVPDKLTSVWSVTTSNVYYGSTITLDSVAHYATARLTTDSQFIIIKNNSIISLNNLANKCGVVKSAHSELYLCEDEVALTDTEDDCVKSALMEDEQGVKALCHANTQMTTEPCRIDRVGTAGFVISSHYTKKIQLTLKGEKMQMKCDQSCVVSNQWDLTNACQLGKAVQNENTQKFEIERLESKVDISDLVHESIVETFSNKFDIDQENLEDGEFITTICAAIILVIWWTWKLAKSLYFIAKNKKFTVKLKGPRNRTQPARPTSDITALLEVLKSSQHTVPASLRNARKSE